MPTESQSRLSVRALWENSAVQVRRIRPARFGHLNGKDGVVNGLSDIFGELRKAIIIALRVLRPFCPGLVGLTYQWYEQCARVVVRRMGPS